MNDYKEWLKNRYLTPVKLPKKDEFYAAISEIEHNFTGRMDAWFANTFILEASQLLINSIELFELGYFDCAYYSLREAMELSTTMVYLSDLPENEKKLEDWKNKNNFPMQSQMINQLKMFGLIVKDMKDKMPDFFKQLYLVNNQINKFVHKQGEKFLYVSCNHPFAQPSKLEMAVTEFEKYVSQIISILAIMRLAIDPFPILLTDEEMYHRVFHGLSEGYSEEFINLYIGQNNLAAYKTTDIYTSIYNSFINNEKRLDCVTDIVMHQYIDVNKLDEIFSQIHLLKHDAVISVLLISLNDKICNIFLSDSFLWYSSNRQSNKKTFPSNSREIAGFIQQSQQYNLEYKGYFISKFKIQEKFYLAQHDERLTLEEINYIETTIKNIK